MQMTSRKLWRWVISLAPFVVVLLVAIFLRTNEVSLSEQGEEALLERIHPFGGVMSPEDPRVIEDLAKKRQRPVAAAEARKSPQVNTAQKPQTSAKITPAVNNLPAVERHPGEDTYSSTCAACHAAGIAGAPKAGDIDAWSPRLKQGTEVLIQHAIDGFQGDTGFMPAKGGRVDLDDAQIADAVRFMLSDTANLSNSAELAAAESAATAVTTSDKKASPTVATAEVATATSVVAPAKPAVTPRPRVERVVLRPQQEPMSGAEVYEHGCYVCHGPGLTGAPRIDDKREWRRRQRKGREQLYQHAINGFTGDSGPMPPKGGYVYLSDAEIKAAVNYMLRNGH